MAVTGTSLHNLLEHLFPVTKKMSPLLNLPSDVFLHFVHFLEVEDAIAFSMTCRSLYELFRKYYEYTFWVETLQKTAQTRPLPCRMYEDITKYDAQALRNLARHFNRLNHNWKTERPRVFGRVKTLTVDKKLSSIAQIAGTPYVITHSTLRRRLSVWSTDSGKRLCSVDAGDEYVYDLSTGWPEHGKFTIALLTRLELNLEDVFIRVLTVDYSSPKVTMDITFEVRLENANMRFYRAIFLNGDVVGILYMTGHEDQGCPFHVLAFNRRTGRSTDIRAFLGDLNPSWSCRYFRFGHVGTSFWNENLYILYEHGDGNSYHSWIPMSMLPYSENIDLPSQMTYDAKAFHRKEGSSSWRTSRVLPIKADFGIVASTIYTKEETIYTKGEKMPVVGINFWVVDANSLAMAEKSGTLPIPSAYSPITIQGTIWRKYPSKWCSYKSTNSGIYFIVAMEDWERKPKMAVIHLQLPDHRFTVHEMEIPPYVKVCRVSGFFIDERLGTITLYISKGKMFVMNYA